MRQTIPLVPAVPRYALHPALFLACAALALLANAASAAAGEDLLKALTPVTNELLAKTAPQDWLMRRGNYRAWGYSALDQINAQNVGRLRLAWAWNMEPGYQEEAPLAHDGVVFLANPKNVVQALDGRTGDLLWEYRRELPKIEGGYHNDLLDRARGTIALYADKVVLATADAHIVTLDARTGKVIWDTAVADYRQGYIHGRTAGGQRQSDRRHFRLHQSRYPQRLFHCRSGRQHRRGSLADQNHRPARGAGR
jgi:alcohol dehydrogenase (cytochrome c)